MPRVLFPLLVFLALAAPALAQEVGGEPEDDPVADEHEYLGAPSEAEEGANESSDPPTSEDAEDVEKQDEVDLDEPDDAEPDDEREDDEREDDEDGFETRAKPSPEAPKVAYDAPNASLVLEPAGLAGLQTTLDALVEYVDGNGNGAYDLGEPVLQRLAIRDLPARIERRGLDVAERDAVYTLPANATLRLRFQHGEGETVKYDIIVEGLAFVSPASRVAIGALSTSSAALEVRAVDGHPAIVGAADAGQVPYMSWVEVVHVDGRDATVGWSVHTSTSRDASSAIVYWSYPQGAMIVHDPELGLTQALREVLGHPQAYALGALATLAILAGGYLARRRRA